MTIIRIILTCLIAYVLIAILCFVYLRWWLAILVCFAVFVFCIFAVRVAIALFVRKLGQSVGGVFEQRGAMMRDAAVEVHSVEQIPPPTDDEGASARMLEDDSDDEEQGASDQEPIYYRVDVTIRVPPPQMPPAGADDVQRARVVASSTWQPNELALLDADAPRDPAVNASNFNAMVQMMQQFTRGYRPRDITEPDAAPSEGDVIEGPRSRRFSFVVGVPPTVRALTFRYYTQSFGRIVLPPAA